MEWVDDENRFGKFFQRIEVLQLIKLKYILVAAIIPMMIGCSNQSWLGQMVQRPTVASSTPPAEYQNPAFQTNMYGRLDGWAPVDYSAKPFSSMEQHSFCEEGGDYDPDMSKDGKLIIFSSLRHSPNPDLYIKRVEGATATRLTSDPASEIQPSLSPNGDKVAYACNRSGNWDIWVIGIDGTNPMRLTTGVSNDIHPSWSPDGKYLVYCSYGTRSQQWELWIINAENPTAKRFIGYGMFPEWSPNPAVPKITYQLSRFRGSQWFSVWTVDFIDGEAKYPTEIVTNVNYACICPSWSPDSSKLAYCTVNKSRYDSQEQDIPNSSGEDIWVVDLDGRNNHRLTSGDASDYSPTWGPDGRVFFCSDRKFIDNIWSVKPYSVDLKATGPVQMSKHPQGGIQAN